MFDLNYTKTERKLSVKYEWFSTQGIFKSFFAFA